MGKFFKGFTIATTGDFGKDRPKEKLKSWIEHNGGRYTSTVDETVTHLVCSKDAYVRDTATVRKAQEYKHCHIVTIDWFDDCLLNKRRLRHNTYLCKKAVQLSAKQRAARDEREREHLRQEGKPTNPESALGIVSSFFDGHLSNLKSKNRSDKPAVEKYTLYEDMYNTQGEIGEDGSDGKEGDATTGSAEHSGSEPILPGKHPLELEDPFGEPLADADESGNALTEIDDDNDSAVFTSGKTTTDLQEHALPPASTADLESTSNPEQARKKSVSASEIAKSTPEHLSSVAPAKVTSLNSAFTSSSLQSSSIYAPSSSNFTSLQASTNPPSDIANHHLYTDGLNFKYNILLVRVNIEFNASERYYLRLYQSHTQPHTYAVHAKYDASKTQAAALSGHIATNGVILAPIGSDYGHAFRIFREDFQKYTGLTWEDRAQKPPVNSKMEDGKRYFTYVKPRLGEPTGVKGPKQSSASGIATTATGA